MPALIHNAQTNHKYYLTISHFRSHQRDEDVMHIILFMINWFDTEVSPLKHSYIVLCEWDDIGHFDVNNVTISFSLVAFQIILNMKLHEGSFVSGEGIMKVNLENSSHNTQNNITIEQFNKLQPTSNREN